MQNVDLGSPGQFLRQDLTWQTISGDNLGNHTATTNIKMSGNWISNDGENEGIWIAANGNAGVGVNTPKNKLDVEGGVVIGPSFSGSASSPLSGLAVEGNVGIGTTSVYHNLQLGILGNSSFPHYSEWNRNIRFSSGNWVYNSNSSAGRLVMGHQFSEGGESLMFYPAAVGMSEAINTELTDYTHPTLYVTKDYANPGLVRPTLSLGTNQHTENFTIYNEGYIPDGTTWPTGKAILTSSCFGTAHLTTAQKYYMTFQSNSHYEGDPSNGQFVRDKDGPTAMLTLGQPYNYNTLPTNTSGLFFSIGETLGDPGGEGQVVTWKNVMSMYQDYDDSPMTTKWFVPNLPGGSSTRHLIWDSNTGQIKTDNNSSLRYKTNVQPLQDDFQRILDVEPVSFTYIGEENKSIGFIAEDFNRLGLNNLVIYDKEGRPDGLQYDKIPLYLIEVLKDYKKRISSLEEEVKVLKSNR